MHSTLSLFLLLELPSSSNYVVFMFLHFSELKIQAKSNMFDFVTVLGLNIPTKSNAFDFATILVTETTSNVKIC
jgi:hypothetical protein